MMGNLNLIIKTKLKLFILFYVEIIEIGVHIRHILLFKFIQTRKSQRLLNIFRN